MRRGFERMFESMSDGEVRLPSEGGPRRVRSSTPASGEGCRGRRRGGDHGSDVRRRASGPRCGGGRLGHVVPVIMDARPVPRPRTGHAVVDLLDQSRSCLAEAASATTAGERYVAAHLAALRAGAAVLAARARADLGGVSGSRRGAARGPRNVWNVLAAVAPELAEWAAFFAAGAGKRAAAEAGIPGAVTARESDDLLRDADAFLGLVCAVLGLPHQQPLEGTAVGPAG